MCKHIYYTDFESTSYLIWRFSLDCSPNSFLIGLCLCFSACESRYPPGEFSNSYSNSSNFFLTLLNSRVSFFNLVRLGVSGSFCARDIWLGSRWRLLFIILRWRVPMNWLSASHASAAAIFPSSLAPSLDCEDIDYFNDKHIYFENQIAANNRLLKSWNFKVIVGSIIASLPRAVIMTGMLASRIQEILGYKENILAFP